MLIGSPVTELCCGFVEPCVNYGGQFVAIVCYLRAKRALASEARIARRALGRRTAGSGGTAPGGGLGGRSPTENFKEIGAIWWPEKLSEQ